MFFKKFFVGVLLVVGLTNASYTNEIIDDYNQDYEEIKNTTWFQTYLYIGEVANAIQLDYEMFGLFQAKDVEKQFNAIVGNRNFELTEIYDFVKQKKISMNEFKLDYQRQLQFVQEAKQDVQAVLKNQQYTSNTLTPKLQTIYTNLLSSLKARGDNLLISLEKMKVNATELEKGHIEKIIDGIKARTSFFNKIKPSSIINARTAVYLKNLNKGIAWAGNALALLDIGITGYKAINNEATLKDYSSALSSVAVFAGTTTAGGVIIVAEGTRSILENSIKLYSEYFDDGNYFNTAEGEDLNPLQMQQYYSYYSSRYIFESKLAMIKIYNELNSNDINIPLIKAYSDGIKSNIDLAQSLDDGDTKGYLSKASFASLFGLSVDAKQINDFQKLLDLDMYEYDKNISQVIVSKLINSIKTDTQNISIDLLQEINKIGDLSYLNHTDNPEDTTQTPPTLLITLPQGASIDGYKLSATQGDTVSFQGGITAGFLRGCIHDAGDSATYTLWYIDIDGKRKSLALDFNSFNQTFSFVMPSSQITMVDLAYDNNIDAEFEHQAGFCGLPTVWESVDSNGSAVDSNETVNLSNGLVAHYEFEGDANDSSGNGNNGTEYGGVAYVDGVIGKAASFDGVDDYILIDKNLIPSNHGTFSLWYYSESAEHPSYIYDTNGYGFYYYYTPSVNRDAFGFNNNRTSSLLSSSTWKFQQWTNLTVSYDLINKVATIFVNGIKIETISTNTVSELTNHTKMFIGKRFELTSYGNEGFHGLIDDFRIYNRALNETEIQELYKLGQAEETVNLNSGLVAHYEFEGDANDSSGNGNNGTEYGGVAYVDGVIGKALKITNEGDRVEIAHTSDIDLSNTQHSISVFFRAENLYSTYSEIFDKTAGSDYALNILSENNKFYLRVSVGNGTGLKEILRYEISLNQNYHFVLSKNEDIFSFYLNGNLIGTNEYSSLSSVANPLIIGAGGSPYDSGYGFNGLIDDLRFYNRALNDSEIQELYKLGQKDLGKDFVLYDGFDNLSSFENNWTQKTSDGCCGAGNPATYKVENGKLILTTNGGSDGYMGIGDGSYFVPNNIILSGDFAVEVSIKELMREKTNGYKDNSGVWLYLTTSNNLETSIVDIGVGGNYSGYFEGYSYNEYNGHRISAYNPNTQKHVFIDEIDLDKLYDLRFKIQRIDNKFTIFYKLSSNSQWIEHTTNITSSEDLIPILRIGSGDGGGTRKNGKFSCAIDYLKVYNADNQTLPLITLKLNLQNETHKDGSIITTPFTKEWIFNQDITDLTISILENSYQNSITTSDFIKEGKTLKVNLTPDTSKAINKLTLQFKDSNGNIVKVSGSETFWSLTKTNHAPRLADGQVTRLVGNSSAYLDIGTYDSDGDTVTLNVEESAGGTVTLSGNRLSASFSDGKVAHTIKIGLSDGKERVIKEFRVIDFSQNSIENYYSDVSSSSEYFDAIAFATLKGVIGGQVNPSDETERIFRPDDNVSLAEALKIVIKAEQKAGLVELKTAEYYRRTFPTWAMPYYTFAVDAGALESEMGNLAYIYPSRETLAQLIVKTLDLEAKVYHIDSNVSFTDEVDFSDEVMLHYAKVAKAFGLFMTSDMGKPQENISRAELALVVERIFKIPHAVLRVSPQSIEYGETLTATLSDIQADAINSSSHTLYNAVGTLGVSYVANGIEVTNPIDSHILPSTARSLYAVLDNDGVKNIVTATINMHYTDTDNDGIQNVVDKWVSDIRYAYDDNNNGIPDILDDIYNLGDKTASETALLDGYTVNIADIIRDGGWIAPDLDGDGISDNNDPDIDGDGVVNQQDAFPRDASEWLDTDGDGIGNNTDTDDDGDGVLDLKDAFPLDKNEWLDTDHDGIGNNADTDDDNDGISDYDEVKWHFNPLDPSDGGSADADGDGVSNADEIKAGSNPLDPNDTKKPKRFVPIMMDNMVIMVPLKH